MVRVLRMTGIVVVILMSPIVHFKWCSIKLNTIILTNMHVTFLTVCSKDTRIQIWIVSDRYPRPIPKWATMHCPTNRLSHPAIFACRINASMRMAAVGMATTAIVAASYLQGPVIRVEWYREVNVRFPNISDHWHATFPLCHPTWTCGYTSRARATRSTCARMSLSIHSAVEGN